jgi:hypothetical protein
MKFRRIRASISYGWCDYLVLPNGDEIWSPLWGRRLTFLAASGVAKAKFERLPKKSLDLIASASGLLYSSEFVRAVAECGLSGIDFQPVELFPGSKVPAKTWFWASITGRAAADPGPFLGDRFELCGVTGVWELIPGKDYMTPPAKVCLLEQPDADFFKLRNINDGKVYLRDSAYRSLLLAGVTDFPTDEIDESQV